MSTPPLAFLDSIGGGEILIIAVVVLLLFGPKRLPEIARLLGRTSSHLNRAYQDFKDQLMRADLPEEPPEEPPPEDEGESVLPPEYAPPPEHPPHASGPPDAPAPPRPPRAG